MAKDKSGGKRGGRQKGGVNPNDIVSTRDLISERESQQEAVDATLTVLRDLYEEYGVTADQIQLAKLKGSKAMGVLGYSDGYNVAINEKYFNSKAMDSAYEASVKSGFHPSNGDKTGLQAVVAHEMGHRITEVVSTKLGNRQVLDMESTSRQIVTEARKQTNHRGNIIFGSKISGYSTHSNAETIAEAVSDVYCNGKKAKAESKAVVSVLKKYLSE